MAKTSINHSSMINTVTQKNSKKSNQEECEEYEEIVLTVKETLNRDNKRQNNKCFKSIKRENMKLIRNYKNKLKIIMLGKTENLRIIMRIK